MEIHLTESERDLVEHAKEAIVRYNRQRHSKGGVDTLYAFLLAESGSIYDGAAFEPNISHATICGERHAIANLVMNEAYDSKIESIVVADPVPSIQDKSTPPCGTCRHLIWQFGRPETSVILMQYIQGDDSWTFPRIERLTIEEFYPYPYEPVHGLWD
jgi:cytidine deaminase